MRSSARPGVRTGMIAIVIVPVVTACANPSAAVAQGDIGNAAYVVDRDGESNELLLAEPFPEHVVVASLDWSPDGTRIAFNATTIERNFLLSRLGLYHVAGAEAGTVTDLGFGASPAWSPDSSRIAFCVYGRAPEFDQAGVFTMKADGTDIRHCGRGMHPFWSSDGEFLYTGHQRPIAALFRIELPAGTETPIDLPTGAAIRKGSHCPGPEGTILMSVKDGPVAELVQFIVDQQRLVPKRSLFQKELGTANGPAFPRYCAATNEVFFTLPSDEENHGHGLYRLNLEADAEPVTILPPTSPPMKLQDITVSPDGQRVAYKSDLFYRFVD